ncbi:hypothetical protein KAR48_17890 [bacterium]|nr:hypothetical protein [bacterium]
MSRYENGRYSLPEKLSNAINAPFAAHPYIAPDESYLIFDSNGELFVSFHYENGKW